MRFGKAQHSKQGSGKGAQSPDGHHSLGDETLDDHYQHSNKGSSPKGKRNPFRWGQKSRNEDCTDSDRGLLGEQSQRLNGNFYDDFDGNISPSAYPLFMDVDASEEEDHSNHSTVALDEAPKKCFPDFESYDIFGPDEGAVAEEEVGEDAQEETTAINLFFSSGLATASDSAMELSVATTTSPVQKQQSKLRLLHRQESLSRSFQRNTVNSGVPVLEDAALGQITSRQLSPVASRISPRYWRRRFSNGAITTSPFRDQHQRLSDDDCQAADKPIILSPTRPGEHVVRVHECGGLQIQFPNLENGNSEFVLNSVVENGIQEEIYCYGGEGVPIPFPNLEIDFDSDSSEEQSVANVTGATGETSADGSDLCSDQRRDDGLLTNLTWVPMLEGQRDRGEAGAVRTIGATMDPEEKIEEDASLDEKHGITFVETDYAAGQPVQEPSSPTKVRYALNRLGQLKQKVAKKIKKHESREDGLEQGGTTLADAPKEKSVTKWAKKFTKFAANSAKAVHPISPLKGGRKLERVMSDESEVWNLPIDCSQVDPTEEETFGCPPSIDPRQSPEIIDETSIAYEQLPSLSTRTQDVWSRDMQPNEMEHASAVVGVMLKSETLTCEDFDRQPAEAFNTVWVRSPSGCVEYLEIHFGEEEEVPQSETKA